MDDGNRSKKGMKRKEMRIEGRGVKEENTKKKNKGYNRRKGNKADDRRKRDKRVK